MSDLEVGARPGPGARAPGPVFDLLVSKLRRPPVRPGTLSRPVLLERLARPDAAPIVSVVAPAGYGKTTLLSQWAEHNGQAFAWVSLDERDNDPKVLLAYVAAALDAVQPVGGRVFEALTSPVSSVSASVVPRLGSALASMTTPVVLVLDDVHLVKNREGRAALSLLAEHIPAGSRLAVAGRDDPPLRTARLRAQGRLLEIGAGDLSLTHAEAASLLRAAGVVLAEAELSALHQRTEGWATGLYLAALAIKEGGSPGGVGGWVGGGDRFVSEYVESELLARISQRRREFLTRTAVLERLSGPLCDAVLDQAGSAATLSELARSNLLLVALDRRERWYRYHHLFRDMLLAELERREPDLVPELHRRAAAWCEANELEETAITHAQAAGDADRAARLVLQVMQPVWASGRVDTVLRWMEWFEHEQLMERYPAVTVHGALIFALLGRATRAEHWAAAAEQASPEGRLPDGSTMESYLAYLRANLCRDGVAEMRRDARLAWDGLSPLSPYRATMLHTEALSFLLEGDPERADAVFARAFEAATAPLAAVVLAERAAIAAGRDDWAEATALADRALEIIQGGQLDAYWTSALVYAWAARVAVHRGDLDAARAHLTRAAGLRPLLTHALPVVSVQALLELARVHLALADLAGARTLMREVDDLLRRRPGLGTLVGQAEALRAQLARERRSSVPAASALTGAELRLLPLLATHLSAPEMAAELFLSPHTIKSELKAIYRKLGASTRTQAVTRARELGLLEG
jgi:LuxR family maltose regulon positive regulatory protein